MAERTAVIIILAVILLLMIIYVITMYELYKSHSFIFATYTPPTPQPPVFYPLGKITRLTNEEIQQRNKIISDSFNQ